MEDAAWSFTVESGTTAIIITMLVAAALVGVRQWDSASLVPRRSAQQR